ncbi:MAG: AhpC/TSA family protein [Parabacteroides sp.]|nr:AhpC/TSA family protein [Parabacteroides sp.]
MLCLAACSKDYTYRIEGKLSHLTEPTVYAVFENEQEKKVDTLLCADNGTFELEEQIDGFHSVTLFFEGRSRWVTAYLEPGTTVSIEGDAQSPLLLQMKGGKINDRLAAFKKKQADLFNEMSTLTQQLGEKANTVEQTDAAARLADVNLRLSEEAAAYVKAHPDEEASVVLIQTFFADPDDTRKIDELLALLDPRLNDFYLVRELEQFSIRSQRIALEAEAPDFTVKNIYGKSMSLDSFANRHLLLAFTAPWCDMCQTEDLSLDEVAMRYSTDQLAILLVSLDDQPASVRESVAKDSIPWNVVTDSAGQAMQLIDLYNVSVLPRCFLIDEEKRIIMKTDNEVEIRQTLERLIAE